MGEKLKENSYPTKCSVFCPDKVSQWGFSWLHTHKKAVESNITYYVITPNMVSLAV